MKKSLFPFFWLILSLVASGCVPLVPAEPTLVPVQPATPTLVPTALPPTPTRVPTATVPPTPTPVPTSLPLTAEVLFNSAYQLPQYKKTVKLKDGVFEAGQGADYLSVTLFKAVALGDLDGDGVEDGAVLLAENGGGSGVFVSVVAMLNQNGQPFQAGAALVDDRPHINALSIRNGQIVVEAIIHGTNDPMCCPTLPVTETYQLSGHELALVQLASQTPDGALRAIDLQSPAPGTQVSDTVQVKGSATFTPFENTLAYRLVDEKGNQLDQGPLKISGAENTFDASISVDRSKIGAGSAVRLEVLDLSAADGATLALDSVDLTIK